MKGREWKVGKDTHKNEKPFYSLVVKLNEEEWGEKTSAYIFYTRDEALKKAKEIMVSEILEDELFDVLKEQNYVCAIDFFSGDFRCSFRIEECTTGKDILMPKGDIL